MRNANVYVVKPKYIFKHPFNKYDLNNPSNRESQNEELTQYFNYGFSQDTMNIYGKLVKRMLKVIGQSKNLEYFDMPSDLMRLNDQIPMDFGGFCKFYDPNLLANQYDENFHTGETLLSFLIFLKFEFRPQYPLIEFVKRMYASESDGDQIDTLKEISLKICQNLDQKYNETMKKLKEINNQVKANPKKKESRKEDSKKHHSESQRKKHKKKSERDVSEERSESRSSSSSGGRASKNKKHKKDKKSKKVKKQHKEKKEKKEKKQKKEKREKKEKRDKEREREKKKKNK